MASITERLRQVLDLADHYERTAAELPEPHGPVTEAFKTAARDIREACGDAGQ